MHCHAAPLSLKFEDRGNLKDDGMAARRSDKARISSDSEMNVPGEKMCHAQRSERMINRRRSKLSSKLSQHEVSRLFDVE